VKINLTEWRSLSGFQESYGDLEYYPTKGDSFDAHEPTHSVVVDIQISDESPSVLASVDVLIPKDARPMDAKTQSRIDRKVKQLRAKGFKDNAGALREKDVAYSLQKKVRRRMGGTPEEECKAAEQALKKIF
jgi:hypothetical protein